VPTAAPHVAAAIPTAQNTTTINGKMHLLGELDLYGCEVVVILIGASLSQTGISYSIRSTCKNFTLTLNMQDKLGWLENTLYWSGGLPFSALQKMCSDI
jgi:hypothetical protein